MTDFQIMMRLIELYQQREKLYDEVKIHYDELKIHYAELRILYAEREAAIVRHYESLLDAKYGKRPGLQTAQNINPLATIIGGYGSGHTSSPHDAPAIPRREHSKHDGKDGLLVRL